MSTEKTKNVIHIIPYGYYAYTSKLNQGLGLLIIEKHEKTVSGLKLNIGKIQKFDMSILSFETLLAYNTIEFVEKVPKEVGNEMREMYKNIV
jgi:hypothetical protein